MTHTVTITREQAQLVRQAMAAAEQAQQTLQTVVSILSAGHVPAGAVLAAVDEATLTFQMAGDA